MANSKTTREQDNTAKGAVLEKKEKIVARDIDQNQYITVRNGFQGKLIYKSKHTGEVFVWDNFGDEQDIELAELKRAKSNAKKFFINNWFMFNDQWIVDYLGMNQYYRYAVKIEDFDKLFKLTPAKLKAAIAQLSDGQKRSVAYRARQLIAEGEIDSNKTISVLEECLGVELIEKL